MLDRFRLQEDCLLTYSIDSSSSTASLTLSDASLDLAEVASVWWRVKPFTIMEVTADSQSLSAKFAEREWRSALDSVEAFTPNARWVNPRASDMRARNKPAQLLAAREIGLTIPPTLVTNDSSRVALLVGGPAHEHIYKTLTWYFEPPDRFIFTSTINEADIQDAEAIRVAPGIFQPRLSKSYEIRATVVGDDIFSIKIDSQERDDTRLDWRRNQHDLSYSRIDIPTDVSERLLRLTRHFNLAYAAHDLIVTPEGECVFLELNAMGQWLWLEDATGAPITEALAQMMLLHPTRDFAAFEAG